MAASVFGHCIIDRWSDAGDKPLETCSIFTTTANAVTSLVPDRMPVILNRDSYDLWLDPGIEIANCPPYFRVRHFYGRHIGPWGSPHNAPHLLIFHAKAACPAQYGIRQRRINVGILVGQKSLRPSVR
jgi:hypothetical protein